MRDRGWGCALSVLLNLCTIGLEIFGLVCEEEETRPPIQEHEADMRFGAWVAKSLGKKG